MDNQAEEDQHNPMIIILGTLIGVALLIIAGIATSATLVLCRKRTSSSVDQIHTDYENVLQEAQKALQQKEEAFIVKIPLSRDNYKPKKINNASRKSVHEVLPIDVDVNALKNVHDILPVEGSNVQTVVIRRNQNDQSNQSRKSLTFSPVNSDTADNRNQKSRNSTSNLRYSGIDEKPVIVRTSFSEDSGKRNHPRVTLNPEGEVLRCIITEGTV